MKIKKHGKFNSKKPKEKFEEFKCENCGCEFSVKEDEYYRDVGTYSSSLTNTLTYTWPPSDTLVCSCPECYRICKKTVTGSGYTPYTITLDSTLNKACKDSITVSSDENSTFTAESTVSNNLDCANISLLTESLLEELNKT